MLNREDQRDTELSIRHDAEDIAALFPALLIEAERIAQTVASGLHGRRRAGPGETFWQHRPYAFGDSVNMIDWRQSARIADRLYIRQNEWEAAAAVYIWCDRSPSMAYTSSSKYRTKLNQARILSTALAILLSDAGERVGLIEGPARIFQGKTAPSRMLEAMLTPQENPETELPKAELSSGARILLLSDYFTAPDEIANTVNALAGGGASGVLLQVCDPVEVNFPFSGRVEFKDSESSDRLTFGETTKLREPYLEKFEEHRALIKAAGDRANWPFVTHQTDRAPQSVLMSLFTILGDHRLWS